MKYFSGLGLKNDWHLFKSLIKNFGFSLNKYDIVGFDYGAILALQYAEQKIKKHERIGKVIFAFIPSLESDVLVMFIQEKLGHLGLKFSKIAQGVPLNVS